MRYPTITPEIQARIDKRLQEIEAKAKNVNGYYLLDEGDKLTIFMSGQKYYQLEKYLHFRGRAFYGASSTYYNQNPDTVQYSFCMTIKKSYKKTIEKVNDFLALNGGQ